MDISSSERLCLSSFDVTQALEAGGELAIPDYYPEIRRVISVEATALPDSKYISDKDLEVGGTVSFSLLYLGDDGTLTSVPYAAEYSQHFSIDEGFEGGVSDIITESSAENAGCRPLGPRTVSLKARVRTRAMAHNSEAYTVRYANEDQSPLQADKKRGLETLSKSIPTLSMRSYSTTGTVTGESQMQGEVKPVRCRGEVLVESVKPSRDALTVKGEIFVSCLVIGDEGVYKTVSLRLPIEERISADGCREGERAAAYGRVASVTATASEGALSVDCEYDLCVEAARSFEVSVTDDVYSVDREVTKGCRELFVKSLICLENGKLSVKGEGRRKAERQEGDSIISTAADARIDRVEVKDKKAVFVGACNFLVYIASCGDVKCEELSVPFEYECPAADDNAQAKTVWRANVAPFEIHSFLEESKVSASCSLSLFAEALKESCHSPVTEVIVGETDNDTDPATIRVCYPEKGQRVWDIVRSFRTRAGECERINRVSRFDLSDGTPLILK